MIIENKINNNFKIVGTFYISQEYEHSAKKSPKCPEKKPVRKLYIS